MQVIDRGGAEEGTQATTRARSDVTGPRRSTSRRPEDASALTSIADDGEGGRRQHAKVGRSPPPGVFGQTKPSAGGVRLECRGDLKHQYVMRIYTAIYRAAGFDNVAFAAPAARKRKKVGNKGAVEDSGEVSHEESQISTSRPKQRRRGCSADHHADARHVVFQNLSFFIMTYHPSAARRHIKRQPGAADPERWCTAKSRTSREDNLLPGARARLEASMVVMGPRRSRREGRPSTSDRRCQPTTVYIKEGRDRGADESLPDDGTRLGRSRSAFSKQDGGSLRWSWRGNGAAMKDIPPRLLRRPGSTSTSCRSTTPAQSRRASKTCVQPAPAPGLEGLSILCKTDYPDRNDRRSN